MFDIHLLMVELGRQALALCRASRDFSVKRLWSMGGSFDSVGQDSDPTSTVRIGILTYDTPRVQAPVAAA